MKHKTGTRKEWLAARIELLKAEKELTRRSDELARRRQELPWVRVDKEYQFETDEGKSSIAGCPTAQLCLESEPAGTRISTCWSPARQARSRLHSGMA